MKDMKRNSVAKNCAQYSLNVVLQEVLDILNAEDGRSFSEKKEEMLQRLRKVEDSVIADTLVDRAIADAEGLRIKTEFWKSGETVPAGHGIVLRKVAQSHREGFLGLKREYSVMQSSLQEKAYCDMIWNEHTSDRSLMLSILRDGTYIGYCGIHNTAREPWEIAIELQPEWTNQGIGYAAVSAMLNEIRSRLGVTRYKVRIEPGNYASQRLFEKLGAVPSGISEFWLHDQKEIAKCEEDNLHQIDEQLCSVAKKFGVEPRKLLTHVLEYTLTWP